MKNLLKNKREFTVITLLFCIFIVFCFSTIVYSSFSSTMNISGIGYSKLETDVRITNFSIYETDNVISNYESFGKNTVSMSLDFNGADGYIIYRIEVTNYSNNSMGIFNITGMPSDLSFEIIDYNLGERLCDKFGNCGLLTKKEFYIKIVGNIDSNITLNFDFRPFYNISYVNFSGDYLDAVAGGEDINVDINFSSDSPYLVNVIGDGVLYSYSNSVLTLQSVFSDIVIEAVNDVDFSYSYINGVQEFTVPVDGKYKVELWGSGAEKRSDIYSATVGKGAYTSGEIELPKNKKIFVYVGGVSSFNGAGDGETHGGSATDVRLVGGEWSNFDSLKSRIMVAAGGGGGIIASYAGVSRPYEGNSPGDAGGLTGYSANYNTSECGYGYSGYGASQIVGGNPGKASSTDSLVPSAWGGFGRGGNMGHRASGGGSGYYGGGHGVHTGIAWPGGGGGSSFISGHEGCDAISSASIESSIAHTGQSVHYSGYRFTNTKMIDGRGYEWTSEKENESFGMPTTSGSSTMTGNTGTGYAKIKLLSLTNQHSITYVDILGNYIAHVSDGADFEVNFGSNAPNDVTVIVSGVTYYNYSYAGGVLTVYDVTGDVEVVRAEGNLYEYGYTGKPSTFIAPFTGVYKVELWGSSGHIHSGVYPETVGKGGYTSGEVIINKGIKMYVYVGGYESFNGNGTGEANGGSGTDIRLILGNWSDKESLKSRIMVAAGGGGGVYRSRTYSGNSPGDAGGLNGYDAYYNSNNTGYGYSGYGGTQTAGGIAGKSSSFDPVTSVAHGGFGYGGHSGGLSSGGGSGYYGGGHGVHPGNTWTGGGGGSSFISGHEGCNAINLSGGHSGQSVHYSGFRFVNTVMIDGRGYQWTNVKSSSVTGMPTFDGNSSMVGNISTGYAKITLLKLK